MKATVRIYNGADWQDITGKIVSRRDTGLTIETDKGVRWSAFNDRVTIAAPTHDLLW